VTIASLRQQGLGVRAIAHMHSHWSSLSAYPRPILSFIVAILKEPLRWLN